MIDLAVLSAPEPSQPSSSSDEEDDCEGSDAESTARSISRDDLLGLPKWTAEDSGGETIRSFPNRGVEARGDPVRPLTGRQSSASSQAAASRHAPSLGV